MICEFKKFFVNDANKSSYTVLMKEQRPKEFERFGIINKIKEDA